jgi:hypothetical protein
MQRRPLLRHACEVVSLLSDHSTTSTWRSFSPKHDVSCDFLNGAPPTLVHYCCRSPAGDSRPVEDMGASPRVAASDLTEGLPETKQGDRAKGSFHHPLPCHTVSYLMASSP